MSPGVMLWLLPIPGRNVDISLGCDRSFISLTPDKGAATMAGSEGIQETLEKETLTVWDVLDTVPRKQLSDSRRKARVFV